MSQALTAGTSGFGHEEIADGRQTIADTDGVDAILTALNDDDCRTILQTVSDSDERLSAAELSDRCDVPLSTMYRKLEMLTDAALLEERLRIKRSGKHTSEYGQRIADVRVSVDSGAGIELELAQ
ncbi:helix-turn-helix domain-containing protein [Halobacteria archaeon AArc-curdl1]|uniref:Helix-turn-helix domain-containing protein n=1 Tax=Natronosalvus hydrolyticus TaxID=2979988 RepID=A0AAP3E697_9EURY|nr:helix-turn-helix domain-containing protein [Halobacteria archaeon AArc-curdl1]